MAAVPHLAQSPRVSRPTPGLTSDTGQQRLRAQARWAWLDGHTKRSRDLHRRADAVAKAERRATRQAVARGRADV